MKHQFEAKHDAAVAPGMRRKLRSRGVARALLSRRRHSRGLALLKSDLRWPIGHGMTVIERRKSAVDRPVDSRVGWLDKRRMVAGPDFNRWLVPPAALAIHLSIGMAYGFSVFWLPLSKDLGGVPVCSADMNWIDMLTASCNWRVNALNMTFVLFTAVLGIAAAVFGDWVERVGPRKAGAVSALCWCGGLALGSLAIHIHQLWLLWLGTGIIGGIGLGLGYISPVSILIRWFPDRRGLATGMAVMGFGGGAMIGAPLAVTLMQHFETSANQGVAQTFIVLAVVYAVFMLGGALGYRLPARGWQPKGWSPPQPDSTVVLRSVHVSKAWKTPAFWCLWAVLCTIVSAGIGVLSLASPMLQEIFGGRLLGLHVGINELDPGQRAQIALIAVGFTGLLSLLNISGRFCWAVLSDRIGRRKTFRLFFFLAIPLYALMPMLGAGGHIALFVIGFCIVMSMFGGAFAVMPAYVADLFGSEMVGAIQGRVLTAWSTAGIIGPLLISVVRDRAVAHAQNIARAYDLAFYMLAGLLCVGLVCNFMITRVDRRYFMTLEEMATLRDYSRHDVPGSSRARELSLTPSAATSTAAAVGVWLAVGLPLLWGIWITIQKAASLLA
jgi:MFS family permease